MLFLNRNIVCLSAVMAMTLVCSACGGNKESHKAENSPHSEDSSNPGSGNRGGGGPSSDSSSSSNAGSGSGTGTASEYFAPELSDNAVNWVRLPVSLASSEHFAPELSDNAVDWVRLPVSLASSEYFAPDQSDLAVDWVSLPASHDSSITFADDIVDEAPAPELPPYLSKKWKLKEARCEGNISDKKNVDSMMAFFTNSKGDSTGIYLSFDTVAETSKIEARRSKGYYRAVDHGSLRWSVVDGAQFISFENPTLSDKITNVAAIIAKCASLGKCQIETFHHLFASESGVQYQVVRYDDGTDPKELVLSNPVSAACNGKPVALTFVANVE